MEMPTGRQLKAGRILAGLDQSKLAKLAKVHITTIIRLEGFDAHPVGGQSGTITAVVNALAKAGIDLGDNGSVRPKGKPRPS
jgi:predicted transcriptional regulator